MQKPTNKNFHSHFLFRYNTQRVKKKNCLTDPSSDASHDHFPLLAVPHDDLPTLGIVFIDAHFHHILRSLDSQLFIDLELNGKTVAIPSEASLNVVALLVGVTGHYILDGSCKDVTIMG